MMDLSRAQYQAQHASQPLVSVLIPSYNHQRFVLECLNSIKRLDYPRLELILSDDCSSDSTYMVAKQWIDSNSSHFESATAIRQRSNLGVVKNLQFLLERANGSYCAYLASDDLLVPSSISDRVKLLEERPEFDAVFGDAQQISDTGLVLKERHLSSTVVRELMSPKFLPASLILHFSAPGPGMLLRKCATLKEGSLGILPEDLKVEDRYIYIRLAAKKKLIFLDKVVAQYRIVPGSATTSEYFNRHAVLSDKYNRHLLRGFSRIAIETKIARNQLEVNVKNVAVYNIRKAFWRGITAALNAWLWVGMLLFRHRLDVVVRHAVAAL